MASQIKVRRQRSNITVIGINGSIASHTKGMISITLRSLINCSEINVNAHIVSSPLTILPSFQCVNMNWPHINQLQLADPQFLKPREVDVILGADVYGNVILPQLKKGTETTMPIAQLSIFGWLVLGPVNSNQSDSSTYRSFCHSTEDDLHQLLTKFWEQEEVAPSSDVSLTPEEMKCEEHFLSTYSRHASGRYIVKLPLISSPDQLGTSRPRAFRCLQSLLRKFTKNPEYCHMYTQFLTEYEQLGHMKRAPQVEAPLRYFLPHHGVLKPESTSTKLRVVFNGSSPTSTGYSLNDILHTGAKLQLDVVDVLFWVRRFNFVFSTDITKMYRQIMIHPDDWDLQLILWLDNDNHIVPYHLTTVTYGTKSAPFLAIRVLLQLIQDDGHNYPLAIPPLTKGRYVDDIYGGADSEDELLKIATDLKNLCMAGGFPLAKWQSNHPSLLKMINEETSSHSPISFDDCPTSTKILGLIWYPQEDYFSFRINTVESGSIITKRLVLSHIAKIFDPLGLVSPVTIRAKMLLQELWLHKLTWDEPLPAQLSLRWCNIREDLTLLASIKVPRWIGTEKNVRLELHGFSDASQLAMAAAIYLVVHSPSTGSKVALLCSKTKVSPLNKLTIPRLELSAALLLAKLYNYVYSALDLDITQATLWTDSSVTLAWIKSHPSRWKEFVRNRVTLIQELTPRAHWRYISGKENPADCASRGITSNQLLHNSLWWTGPPWLSKSEDSWPHRQPAVTSAYESESKPISLFVMTNPNYRWDLISRYSSLYRLLRITSICFRVLARLNKIPNTSLATPLNSSDLERSRIFWIKETQYTHFTHELKALSSNLSLSKSHAFNRLTAFIDQDGVIRVGGRITNSLLDPDSKHPAILPRHSLLTNLIIDAAHKRTLHGGTQITLSTIRQQYWIIGGRAPVKSYILKCVICARQRGIRAQQLMGQLPAPRVVPSRPFLHTGVDYAGPLTIKAWKGRGSKTHKGWVCVFVCFATSAVHLEVVSDYSSDCFIAAYRRFTARRGISHTLYSDCGTNFIGADAALKDLFTRTSTQNKLIADLLMKDGTNWSFNPPAAPHMGGKWESTVKSFKFHFNRTVRNQVLTFEELATLLTQIEAILNSRPLEPLSDDPDDCSALTPGHFLTGTAITTLPEPSLEGLSTSRLSRWQFIQQRVQQFWSIWSAYYLQRQLSISKWHHPSHEIKVGSLVLLTDERLPPCKWPLGRVMVLHPGQDGLARVVTLKTSTSTLTRPITKLAILPIPCSHEDSSTTDVPLPQ